MRKTIRVLLFSIATVLAVNVKAEGSGQTIE